MEHTILKGTTVEEKLACAETALRQLSRRILTNRIRAPLTPIILSGYHELVQAYGYIFRGIIPVAGTVARIYLFIEQLSGSVSLQKNPLGILVRTTDIKGKVSEQSYKSSTLDVSVIGNFKVNAGDTVSIAVNESIEGVWYGIAIEPDIVIYKTVDPADLDILAPVELAMIED